MGAQHGAGLGSPEMSIDFEFPTQIGRVVQGILMTEALAGRETTEIAIWKKNPRVQICFMHLSSLKNRLENF